MDDDTPVVVQAASGALALAAAVWLTWCTVIAFIGGTMPLIGVETEGGVGYGLLWVFVFDPIAMTVAYWASMILLLPIMAAAFGVRSVRDRRAR